MPEEACRAICSLPLHRPGGLLDWQYIIRSGILMKIALIILALMVLGIGAYVILALNPELAPATGTPNVIVNNPPVTVDDDDTQLADSEVVMVDYTDQGFAPRTLTVSVGDTVRFVNQSSHEMWVGVDEHPSHTQYDGTSRDEHCPGGSAFDQCARSGPGTSWDFTFTTPGSFDYHSHVRSQNTGTIIVR